jgi:hypothetical protein
MNLAFTAARIAARWAEPGETASPAWTRETRQSRVERTRAGIRDIGSKGRAMGRPGAGSLDHLNGNGAAIKHIASFVVACVSPRDADLFP